MSTLFLILRSLCWLLLGLTILILVSLYIRGAFRAPVKYRVKDGPSPAEPRFSTILASLSTSLMTHGTITQFWAQPDQIQAARIKAIQAAQHTIHFETFFMTPGRRANDFAAAVSERAAAGVEVQLMIDTYGTKGLSKRYWQRLKAAGVQIAFFNPFDWRAPSNYAGRTHRKLLLIDGQVGFIGGAGISDDWDGEGQTSPWLDIEARLEGEIVPILEGLFVQHWTYSGGEANLRAETFRSNPHQEQALILVTPGNNPTYRFSPIRALKENTIVAARKRIWLASPYFIPDQNSQELLIEAKQAGVDVRILTTSLENIDKKYVYYAAYELYGDLLKGGVEIYEYLPNMTHAKMLLIDDQWVNIGSANFDPRSFFHNEELDISTADPTLQRLVEQVFEQAFIHSQNMSLKDWKQRSWWRHRLMGSLVRFVQWQL